MATKCQTPVLVQVHLYCPVSFACWWELAIWGEIEIWTTEENGSIWLVPLLCYSELPLLSHKTQPQLVVCWQNLQPNSPYFLQLVFGQLVWKRPTKSSVCSLGGRWVIDKWSNKHGVERARLRCNLHSQKMSPLRLFAAFRSQISWG